MIYRPKTIHFEAVQFSEPMVETGLPEGVYMVPVMDVDCMKKVLRPCIWTPSGPERVQDGYMIFKSGGDGFYQQAPKTIFEMNFEPV